MTKSVVEYYEAHATAIRTKACSSMKYNEGDEITVMFGEWIGQCGFRQPSWTEYLPTRFRTIKEAQESYSGVPTVMSDFKIVGEPYIVKTTVVTNITTEIMS